MRKLVFLFCFIFIGGLFQGIACDCSEWVGKQSASAIFAGKVLAVRKFKGGFLIKFVADTIYKGGLRKELIVKTTALPACGYAFKVGARYLVYGRRRSGRAVIVSRCSRTKQLGSAIKSRDVVLEDDKH